MSIAVKCACGRTIRFSDEWAGQRRKCFYCGQEVNIPSNASPAGAAPLVPPPPPGNRTNAPHLDDLQLIPPAPSTQPRTGAMPARSTTLRPRRNMGPDGRPIVCAPADGHTWNRRYLFLALALIPLVFSLLIPSDPHEVEKRLESTLQHMKQEERDQFEQVQADAESDEQIVMSLPEHRIEGAHLPRDTWMHWVYALLSACAFLAVLAVLFPLHNTKPGHLVANGVFTGTAGIVLLLGFQWAAMYTQGMWIRGRGIMVLIFLVVKFIGFSYACALDPKTNFLVSVIGFTCGVGFCEEVCKMIPLIWHYKDRATLDWRGACLWGLASGVGFGVSEGITYSADYYNGVHTGGIYLIRFVSCVGLHAIWAGAAGIILFYRQYALQSAEGFFGHLWELVQIVFVPMLLHGLYDTFLKKEMDGLALLAALVSFGWLAYQIERMRSLEVKQGPPESSQPLPA